MVRFLGSGRQTWTVGFRGTVDWLGWNFLVGPTLMLAPGIGLIVLPPLSITKRTCILRQYECAHIVHHVLMYRLCPHV